MLNYQDTSELRDQTNPVELRYTLTQVVLPDGKKQTEKTLEKKIALALPDSDAHSWKSLELGDFHTKPIMRVTQFQHT